MAGAEDAFRRARDLTQAGRRAEAAAAYGEVLALHPDHLPALVNRAVLHLELGRHAQALEDADRALTLDPGLAAALRQRARALMGLERWEDALASALDAAARDPGNAQGHALAGRVLFRLKRFQDAAGAADRALALDGDAAPFHADRAAALNGLGDYAGALAAYGRAVELQPANADYRLARGVCRLRLHDFQGGWADYEARWSTAAFRAKGRPWHPELGEERDPDLHNRLEDVAGKRVLVVPEQGFGDQISFAGALPSLAAVAGSVTVQTAPRLKHLFEASFPHITVTESTNSLDIGGFDRIIPIGGLGHIHRNAPGDFPRRPYLAPRPEVLAAWRGRLGPGTEPLRIGYSWRGGFPRTGGPERSMTLETVRPLLARDGCEAVSLQYGDVEAEVAQFSLTLPRPVRLFPDAELRDFEQLAALVLGLDLIVTIDTTLAHLAGALGAPCLVMVPSTPEWRYGAEGSATPWYSDAFEVVRQSERGNWAPVIETVGARIDRRLGRDAI